MNVTYRIPVRDSNSRVHNYYHRGASHQGSFWEPCVEERLKVRSSSIVDSSEGMGVRKMPSVSQVGEMTLTSDPVSTRNLVCVCVSITNNRRFWR